VAVSVAVLPAFTVMLAGVRVPPVPAVPVTTYCAMKLAVTVQLALIAAVV
jgi:hypothetical protein